MSHVEYLANGLGAPSVLMLLWAVEGRIPATVSITADTGDEADCLWSTGERTDAGDYWRRVVEPIAAESGIAAYFARSLNRHGEPVVGIGEHTEQMARAGKLSGIKQPLFGSDGGRYGQSCTKNWKAMAINQQLRRLVGRSGTATGAQGIHFGETHRVKGQYLGDRGDFSLYRATEGKDRGGRPKPVKWLSHYYPFVDRRLRRNDIYAEMERRGVPYLVSSECDSCPHKDAARWLRTDAETLVQIAHREALFGGQLFYTDRRIPLLDAVEQMREEAARTPGLFDEDRADFGCPSGGLCGV